MYLLQAYDKIEASLTAAQEASSNLDLYVMEHKEFGKGLMKKCRVSPDAFIQMALQLAHYRVRIWNGNGSIGMRLRLKSIGMKFGQWE